MRGKARIVPRLPELVALLGLDGPAEGAAAIFTRDGARPLSMVCDVLLRPMKLKKEGVAEGVVGAEGAVDSAHRGSVEIFRPRQRQAALNGFDHRRCGAARGRKGADCRAHGFGRRMKLQRDVSYNTERAFAADKKMREVVAC